MIIDIFTIVLVLVTFIFTVDDLFIDFVALRFRLRPRLISSSDLLRVQGIPQRRIAIIIANWKESDVLERMVRGNVRRLKYHNYHFFLGVYPNDLETWHVAKRVEELFPHNVTVIVNSQQGPTSKGQMLNEIVRQIFSSEEKTGGYWDSFLMQDSEDVLHPYSLALLNEACTRAEFIQLPVYSFVTPLRNWIGGVYMDEFSEVHVKDLLVRCQLGAAVPSAGVGTLIQRGLVLKLMEVQNGDFLNENTLTEDYQLGLLSKRLGFKTSFLCAAIRDEAGRKELVATREYFPDELQASIRQKARWVLGIVYQGMDSLKWEGTWIDKYFLWRDRRGPLNAMMNIFSAAFVMVLAGVYLWQQEAPSVLANHLIVVLLSMNGFHMFWRIFQRMRFVVYVNGWRASLGVIPRWFVANFINILASLKAHNNYQESLRKGVRPAWQKTTHVLPVEFGKERETQL